MRARHETHNDHDPMPHISKTTLISFTWQHILLLVSLYILTLGAAVCVRSQLGASVISTIPCVMSTAGMVTGRIPAWTIGTYTILMNALFVVAQMVILRWIAYDSLPLNALVQVAGCTILGIGIALEVRCGSVTMPGEGITIAISKVTGMRFHKAKIWADTTLVALSVLLSILLLGSWQWRIVGMGTLFAMVYVGLVVRAVGRRLGWFDRLLAYRPGFRRYVYGLARYVYRRF